jgi:hypothetical protein
LFNNFSGHYICDNSMSDKLKFIQYKGDSNKIFNPNYDLILYFYEQFINKNENDIFMKVNLNILKWLNNNNIKISNNRKKYIKKN